MATGAVASFRTWRGSRSSLAQDPAIIGGQPLCGQPLSLHGWVYGLADGIVNDLGIEADSADKLDADYVAAVANAARAVGVASSAG